MNNKLENTVIKMLVEQFERILLINQEIVSNKKEKGIKTYTIDEYNNIMNIFYPNGYKTLAKRIIAIKKKEQELSNNLLLTNGDIEELVSKFKEYLLKYGITSNKEQPITYLFSDLFEEQLIEDIINKTESKFDKKYQMLIDATYNLGINSDLMINYCYNPNKEYFTLKDSNNKYICDIGSDTKERIYEINPYRKSKGNYYLAKDLFLIKLKNKGEDIVYKNNNKYESIFFNIKYDDINIEEYLLFNEMLEKCGLDSNEVYTFDKLVNNIDLISNYINNQDDIEKLVDIIINYWYYLIFDKTNDYTYNENITNDFINKFKLIIRRKITNNDNFNINIFPSTNNELVELLEDLVINPSNLVIGKNMKINNNKIIVKDIINDKEEVIYNKEKLRKRKI